MSLHPVLSQQAILEYQTLLHILSEQQLQQGSLDQRVIISNKADITTSEVYKLLSYHGINWAVSDYVWHRSIPHKYRVFLWLAFRGRLNTKDNMTIKHWRTDPYCDSCLAIETIDHMVLRCKAADLIWRIQGLAIEASSSNDILEFVEKVSAKVVTTETFWPICFAACAHSLWITRNKRIFQNVEDGIASLQNRIQEYISYWSYRTKPKYRASLHQWSQLLLQVN